MSVAFSKLSPPYQPKADRIIDNADVISVKPDGAVPDDLLKDLLDKSRLLVLGSFSRKRQKEILEGADKQIKE